MVIMVTVMTRDSAGASEKHFVKLTQPVSGNRLGVFLNQYFRL